MSAGPVAVTSSGPGHAVDWDTTPEWASPEPAEPPPRRRGRLLVTVGAVLIVVALAGLAVTEWWARADAEEQVRSALAAAGVTGEVEVSIGRGMAPSVLRAATFDRLDRVRVTVRDGQVGGVPVVVADYRLEDLTVDAGLGGGEVRVRRFRDGRVRLVIDPVIAGAAAGIDLRADGGRLSLGSPGVPARARIAGDDLVITPRDASSGVEALRIPAADSYLLPCRPEVEVAGEMLELSCSGRRLPGLLRGALGPSAAGGGRPGAPVAELPTPQTTVRDGG